MWQHSRHISTSKPAWTINVKSLMSEVGALHGLQQNGAPVAGQSCLVGCPSSRSSRGPCDQSPLVVALLLTNMT